MTARPATTDLLLAILGHGPTGALANLSEREWAALAEAASWHGLMTLLWQRLQALDAAHLVPAATRRRLTDAETLDSMRSLARSLQIRELLTALHARGVPVVLLKGAFLAEHAYPCAATRPMSDLDLLVPAPRLGTATAALFALGYAPASGAAAAAPGGGRHEPALRRRGRLAVELHRAIEPCMAPFSLCLPEVWARARPVCTEGVPALSLAPEDLLLHLATHMGRSHLLGASLVSVCDVAAWTERFGGTVDWDALVHRARASGTHDFVHAALGLARRALAAPVPADVLPALGGRPDNEVAIDHAVRLLGSPPALLVGARSVSYPGESGWARARRIARALLITPARLRGGPMALAWEAGEHTRRDGYLTRWAAVTRLALRTGMRRGAVEQVARVRWLRAWAAEAGGSGVNA
ncbi:MAG TPA: nucleotidyltransferase family protein [Gemmatimonadaceae bacterium]|nr:nucleotidyltransferase family protein [Gemmatimonadaceae bacterium]